MKTRIPFCLVFLFPVCHAQCDLHLPDSQLVIVLNEAGFISESDPSKFTLQDLTYLCFVRSSTDNTRFDQVRVSMLYTFDSATDQSAQATFSLCLAGTFRFTSGNTYTVTQDPHLTENTTREDCQDCLDNSTFARPTFCRLGDPCDAAPCANGGTCSRTGLTDFSCACPGNWGGPTCNDCSLTCQNGGTRNESTCTCDCAEGYGGVSCEACSRTCSNGGTLDPRACTCSCAGGFSGANCETCALACQNGGTPNGATCTCGCAGGYSGDDCGIGTCTDAVPSDADNSLLRSVIIAAVCTCQLEVVLVAIVTGLVVHFVTKRAVQQKSKSSQDSGDTAEPIGLLQNDDATYESVAGGDTTGEKVEMQPSPAYQVPEYL